MPETKDILAVFPSLKRIELLEGPQTDLYKYLTEHVETPLEYVRKESISLFGNFQLCLAEPLSFLDKTLLDFTIK